MSWIVVLLLLSVVAAALVLIGRMDRRLWGMTGAALCVALAGYAWQGRPMLKGSPVSSAQAAVPFDEDMAKLRNDFGNVYGTTGQWLILSDGLARQGKTKQAVNVLGSALRAAPQDAMLWVGFGNALLQHGGGQLSPAVEYSYRQAMKASPDGSAGPYFYGLALAKAGRFGEARRVWSALLSRMPEQAALHGRLQADLARLDAIAGRTGQ